MGSRRQTEADIVRTAAGHEVDKDGGDGDHLRQEAHEDDAVAGEVEPLDQPAAKKCAATSGGNHYQPNQLCGHSI